MRLSEHFTYAEMMRSTTAENEGIDNTPDSAVLKALRKTAAGMERVREVLKRPIIVTSGYRCQDVERALKRQPRTWISTSQHAKGEAVDFVCPKFGTPYSVCKAIVNNMAFVEFDQLILEYDNWVHISFSATGKNRFQTLTIRKGTGYALGINKK